MNTTYICYWETVGTNAPIAVGSSPIDGVKTNEAARRKFHRTTAPSGLKVRVKASKRVLPEPYLNKS